MPFWLSHWIAAPGAALAMGVISLASVMLAGRHRDAKGRTSRRRIASAVMFGSVGYTLLVIVVAYFSMGIHIKDIVEKGFGEERLIYLFVFVLIDVGARYLSLFDHHLDDNDFDGPEQLAG